MNEQRKENDDHLNEQRLKNQLKSLRMEHTLDNLQNTIQNKKHEKAKMIRNERQKNDKMVVERRKNDRTKKLNKSREMRANMTGEREHRLLEANEKIINKQKQDLLKLFDIENHRLQKSNQEIEKLEKVKSFFHFFLFFFL